MLSSTETCAAGRVRRLGQARRAVEAGAATSLGKTLAVAVAITLASDHASAAMLGSLTTSVGVVAALAALLALGGWPGALAGGAPATTALLVFFAAAALLLWGTRRPSVPPAFSVPGAAPLRPRPPASRAPLPRPELRLPADRDRAELTRLACRHFIDLHTAWDAGDIGTLQSLTTADMLDELLCHLPERGPGPNRTEVVTLQAELLGFEDLAPAYLLSVEFSGTMREGGLAGASPFREFWMLAQAKNEPLRWRLARHQALL